MDVRFHLVSGFNDTVDVAVTGLAGLGVTQPQGIAGVVPQYLERFQAKGQYAHYRG